MANDTTNRTTAVSGPLIQPTRKTDLRERNISGLITSTDQGGGQIPTTQPTLRPDPAGGGQDFGIGTQTITPENTLRNQRLDFEARAGQVAGPGGFERVKSRNTTGAISRTFEANLPALMQKFKDESRQLVGRTAAMGRTGSGLFNRETGFVGDRALQAREALLGNLTFQATQADANRALQAALGNQGAGIQSSSLAAQVAGANANRALQVDFARQQHFAAQQAREDQLARDAQSALQIQAMLAGQGFQNQPTGAVGQAAGAAQAGAGQFGANAGQINAGVGNLASETVQAFTPPPRQDIRSPRFQRPMFEGRDVLGVSA
jgi:hypothetical protein